HTHVHDDRVELVPSRARGYAAAPGGSWVLSDWSSGVVGATGVYSTIEDMAKWDANLDTPRIGDGHLLRELTSDGRLDDGTHVPYGGGLRLHSYRGLRTLSHGGISMGFRAHYLRFPDERVGILCL